MSNELTGKAFGPYVLQDFVRRGGMASIYRGYHAALERSVAVKVMSADLLRDPNFLTRFSNEARMLARLSHPHILPVFDSGEANGMPYIVMPLMAGSLQDRLIAGQPMPAVEALPLLTSMAEALDYAHAQGVLHRDVKPNNVLFDAHGNPYLADFGIAKSLQATSGLTGTGIVGTLEYMSPEQARGDALDGRSDVYSLAMVAYQLLTGQLAFSATTPAGYIFKHISEAPKPPREVNPLLAAEIETVLLIGLAKDPARRYQTAQDFTRALADAHAASVAKTPTAAHGEEPARQSIKPPRTPTPEAAPLMGSGVPRWVVGVGIVGLLAVIGFGWALSRPNAASVAQATATGEPAGTVTEPVAASATPAPTSNAPPTSPPTSTATLQVALLETFIINTNNWPTGDYANDREAGRRTLGNGVYRWQMRANEGVFSWAFGDQQTFADLRASVTVTQTGGADTTRYGLVLRSADQSRYDAFLINQRGEYALVRFEGGQFTNLIGGTASAALRTEGANVLALETSGPGVVLFANGQPIGQYADATQRPDSSVGLVVDVDKGLELEVEFAELEVRLR